MEFDQTTACREQKGSDCKLQIAKCKMQIAERCSSICNLQFAIIILQFPFHSRKDCNASTSRSKSSSLLYACGLIRKRPARQPKTTSCPIECRFTAIGQRPGNRNA